MPHWPSAAEAEPAVDGEYIVDSDDLIVGFASTPIMLSRDEFQKQYGRSTLERIAPLQAELNRAYDPDMIAKRKAEFDALPWYRKAWLRWRYR